MNKQLKKYNKNINVSPKRKYYYGLSILKVLLAFDVINGHCFNKKSTSNKIILYLLNSNKLHVPSFIIMSFYFTHETLISQDFNKINNRLERLLIPYIGWPIILFSTYNFIHFLGIEYYSFPFKKLIHQIILGNAWTIPFHFWFLFDLIITNILFLFIILIKRNYLFTFIIILIFCYFLQYSQLNYQYMNLHEPSLSKEIEFIPFAITGFIIFELNIIKILKRYKIQTFIISLLLYKLILKYEVFSNFKGFAFHGLKFNICSICLIIIFSLFSSEENYNKYLKLFKTITSFTGGIYYIHRIIEKNFKNFFVEIKKGSLVGLITIYLISYMICFIGTFFFNKTRLKYLFI